MSTLEIFEKVNLIMPIEQRRFFNFLNDTVGEISARYDKFVFEPDTEYQPITSLSDEIIVLPLYHNALVDNIIFLAAGDETHKTEFFRKIHEAYLNYWNEDAKGRKMKGSRWW